MTNWRLQAKDCALLVVDAQEKLTPVLLDRDLFVKKLAQLITGARYLDLPVFFSEQYPKGLGPTLKELKALTPNAPVFEKTAFSAGAMAGQIDSKVIVIAGCEAHICVRQTVLDFRSQGKSVVLIADAVASRHAENREIALQELRAEGVKISSVEALLFELLGDAKHPRFKEISALIR